jgi:hypothetical protein
MKKSQKILVALFSALVLLVAVTLAGSFGDEDEFIPFIKGNESSFLPS